MFPLSSFTLHADLKKQHGLASSSSSFFFFSSGEGPSSSRLSRHCHSAVMSGGISNPPPSPQRFFSSPGSLPQTTPILYGHLFDSCPPGVTSSLVEAPPSGHTSDAPRCCSAPEGLLGGAGIPEMVVCPLKEEEEEVFPRSHTGKCWHGSAFLQLHAVHTNNCSV